MLYLNSKHTVKFIRDLLFLLLALQLSFIHGCKKKQARTISAPTQAVFPQSKDATGQEDDTVFADEVEGVQKDPEYQDPSNPTRVLAEQAGKITQKDLDGLTSQDCARILGNIDIIDAHLSEPYRESSSKETGVASNRVRDTRMAGWFLMLGGALGAGAAFYKLGQDIASGRWKSPRFAFKGLAGLGLPAAFLVVGPMLVADNQPSLTDIDTAQIIIGAGAAVSLVGVFALAMNWVKNPEDLPGEFKNSAVLDGISAGEARVRVESHVGERFYQLENQIKSQLSTVEKDIKVTIYGDSSTNKHWLGTGYAADEWASAYGSEEGRRIAESLEQTTGKEIERFKNAFANEPRVKIELGVVNGRLATETNYMVFPTDAANWRLENGLDIQGKGPASSIGPQRPGVWGVAASPESGLGGVGDLAGQDYRSSLSVAQQEPNAKNLQRVLQPPESVGAPRPGGKVSSAKIFGVGAIVLTAAVGSIIALDSFRLSDQSSAHSSLKLAMSIEDKMRECAAREEF